MTPHDALNEIVRRLHATAEPDEDLASEIGVGELENLIRGHGEALWPVIEQLARSDERFRRALRSVWAYDSPEYDRRTKLLEELGEFWPVSVRFIVQPEDFGTSPTLAWRAVEVEGDVSREQLSRILHELSEWATREQSAKHPAWVRERRLSEPVLTWSRAMDALQRAHRKLLVAEGPPRPAFVTDVEGLRTAEATAWQHLTDALS